MGLSLADDASPRWEMPLEEGRKVSGVSCNTELGQGSFFGVGKDWVMRFCVEKQAQEDEKEARSSIRKLGQGQAVDLASRTFPGEQN